jgi:hypothetical protein
MARPPAGMKEQRRHEALELLAAGHSYTATVSELSARWGVCRRTARNYSKAALEQLRADCEMVAGPELLSATIHRLQELARKAEEREQFSAAVGALRTLADLTGLSPDRRS